MSLGYSKYGIIGGPLDEKVIEQLNLRKKVVGRRTGRQPSDIEYLNSTTGWVRVTSAVDIVDENAFPGSEYEYSEASARLNQLFGGTYSVLNGPRGGLIQREDGRFSDASAYQYSETQGIVPMAGITNFQVQSKGLYGALKAASFNFTVHSVEQFNIMEQLYLRPGFSILLEWGHSQFIDEGGNLNSNIVLYNANKFLRQIKEPVLRRELLDIQGKNNNFYNYDFMYGIIKNFAWSFNGLNYECQVDVISKGELISSIRSSFISYRLKENEEYNTDQTSSDVETILNKLRNTTVENVYKGESNTPSILSKVKEKFLNSFDKETEKFKDIFSEAEILVSDLNGSYGSRLTKYITLGTFLKLLNKVGLFVGPQGTPLLEFFTGANSNISEEEAQRRTPRFTTFPEHLALNPYINILPKPNKNGNLNYNVGNQVTNLESNVILNIFISVDFILDTFELVRRREKKDDNLYSVIEKILSETEKNLGDINEFSIHYEEDESLYYVVDRKVVPSQEDFEKSANDNNPKSYIDLVGLNSEVENLNIISKLSGNLTSMIAIAAQNGPNTSSDADILNIQKWNEGLRDRHFTEKSEGNIAENTGNEPQEGPFEVNSKLDTEYKNFIEEINNSENDFYIGFEENFFTSKKVNHRAITSQYLKKNTEYLRKNTPGLIPFELSFTIKGISGMKIGQAFKINEFFLPERYRGKVAFIITGLEHKVQNNRWTTDVKSQIIII